MRATVLLFNFTDKEKLEKILELLAIIGLNTKVVEKKDYNQTIGYLSGVEGSTPAEKEYDGKDLEDEMLMMAGLTNEEVDMLLVTFRDEGIPRIHRKAVLTKTNQAWSVIAMFDELSEEHKEMQKFREQRIKTILEQRAAEAAAAEELAKQEGNDSESK